MMQRYVLALALVAALCLPASVPAVADASLTLVPAVPGAPVQYRITRIAQTANGPTTTNAAFELIRRSATTLVLQRANADGTPNLSVLTQAPDDSLALAEDARGAAADADLADVLYGMNLAIAATHGTDAAGKNPWNVAVPLAPAAGAPTAAVAVVPNGGSADFDFAGEGSGFANPARRPPSDEGGISAGAGGGGFPRGGGGGFPGGGGGFPGGSGGGPGGGPGSGDGGGFPRRGSGGGSDAPRGTMPVAVRIDGHVSAGRITRVAVTETRSVTIGGLPYVNVGSWSIAVGK